MGLFDMLTKPRPEEQDYPALSPFDRLNADEQVIAAGNAGAAMAGRGLGQAIGGAMGLDTRTRDEKMRAALKEVSAMGFDPADVDAHYKALVGALHKHGLAAEAMEAAKEWRGAKSKMDLDKAHEEYYRSAAGKADHRINQLMEARAKWAAMLPTNPAAQKAIDAIDRELAAIGVQRPAGQTASPELIRLQQALRETTDPAERAQIQQAIANLLAEKGKTGKAGDESKPDELTPGQYRKKRIEQLDRAANDKAAAARQKLTAQEKVSLQRSRELANRVVTFIAEAIPLVNRQTAGVVGLSTANVSMTPAYRLRTILESVRANIGFGELQAMRDAAKTGGALGQISDFENRLMQAVKGSLDQGLEPDDLVRNLHRIGTFASNVTREASRLQTQAAAVPSAPADTEDPDNDPDLQIDPEVQAERDRVAQAVRAGETTAPPGTDPAIPGIAAGTAAAAQTAPKLRIRKVGK